MNAVLRMLVGVALIAGACYGWLEANRAWFAFDPLSLPAWQAAADAISGVRHFDAFSAASWSRAVELATRPGVERFASIWVIDTIREAAWLALNLLAVTAGPVWIAFRAAEVASDTAVAVRRLASALARPQPRRRASHGGTAAVPAARPSAAAAVPAAAAHPPAASPAAPPAAGLSASSLRPDNSPAWSAARPPAEPQAAEPRGAEPQGAEPQGGEPHATAQDVDVARAEVESTIADFAFLRHVAPSASEDLLLRQLAEAAARSNVVEAWPGITLVAAQWPTPTNRVFAAGDATVVVLIADRPGPDLDAWASSMSDWLADQLTEVAGDELFSDAFDPLKPAAVLAVREPGHWVGTVGMPAGGGSATIAISRLDEYFVDLGRRHGPVHPQLRDLLDDAFGYH